MKSIKHHKRKFADVSKKHDEYMGVGMMKSANGVGRVSQKVTETMRMPHLEPQIQPRIPPVKVKLQLFPINDEIRVELEKDGHNPFLELTLSARKRISSVVRHLNSKWASSVAKGQLMLFPYSTKLEQVASCKRWSLNDSNITAWEVFTEVGSPSIFRLKCEASYLHFLMAIMLGPTMQLTFFSLSRYGWTSNFLHSMFVKPSKSCLLEGHKDSKCPKEKKLDDSSEKYEIRTNVKDILHTVVSEQKISDVPTDFVVHSSIAWDDNLTNLSIGGLLSEISMQGKLNKSDPNSENKHVMPPVGLISDFSIGDLISEASLLGKMCHPGTSRENESSLQPILLAASDLSIGALLSEASLLSHKNKLDERKIEAGHTQIKSPWFDELTALSIGGLLSEASLQAKAAGGGPELRDAKSSLLASTPASGLSDLISAQVNWNLEFTKPSSSHEPNHLSILDAEETCHAFPVWKLKKGQDSETSNSRIGSSGCSKETISKPVQFPMAVKKKDETAFPQDFFCQELKTSPSPLSLGAFNEDSSLQPIIHQSLERVFGPFDLLVCSRPDA